MTHLEHYKSEVATVSCDASVREVADQMAHYAIGSLVVVDSDERPVGIVTDRDLTCRVVALERDPKETRVNEIMSEPVITASPKEPLEKIVSHMKSRGIRRLPVIRGARLVGIVTLDDLVARLGEELGDLGETIGSEIAASRKEGRKLRRREHWEGQIRGVLDGIESAGEEARDFLERELKRLGSRSD